MHVGLCACTHIHVCIAIHLFVNDPLCMIHCAADHGLYKEEISLSEDELHMCDEESAPLTGAYISQPDQLQVRSSQALFFC